VLDIEADRLVVGGTPLYPLVSQLCKHGTRLFLLDLASTRYIDSCGLADINQAALHVKEQGGASVCSACAPESWICSGSRRRPSTSRSSRMRMTEYMVSRCQKTALDCGSSPLDGYPPPATDCFTAKAAHVHVR
jgi:hypothetical protein